MKYFAKKEIDNSFGGWYLPEVHETMFENGVPKFSGIEFTDEQYNQIMSNLKGELRFNNQGQLIDYIKKPMPEGMINGKYDYSTETWIDLTTDKEKAKAQYDEYNALNNPLRVEDMEREGLYTEWSMLMRDLETILSQEETIEDRVMSIATTVPVVSEKLKSFKDRFKFI